MNGFVGAFKMFCRVHRFEHKKSFSLNQVYSIMAARKRFLDSSGIGE
jgi:hypothetical protein